MAEATTLRPTKAATSAPGSAIPSNTDDIEHFLRESDQEKDMGQVETGNRLSELPELPSMLKTTPGEKMAERPEMQPRRSVQFARLPVDGQLDDLQDDSTAYADNNANDNANGHVKPVPAIDSKASRTSALLSRIKIRPPTTPKFERSPIDFAASSPGDRLEPGQSSNEYATPAETPRGFTSEDEEDADAEGSEDEEGPSRFNALQRLKRKTKRPQGGGDSMPNSPMFRPSFFTSFSQQAGEPQTRPGFMRRATTTDVEPESRLGVSEDEGHSRLARKASSPWMRGKRIMHRRSSSNQLQADDSSRPGAFRRALTNFGPSQTPTEPMSPSPWRVRRDQTMSAGAARWKQIKASLKTIGRAKKLENPMDTIKSAELISELTAGAPAALMIASIFQRDEGGSKKIPILLEQLKVKLTNSQAIIGKSGDRHLTFRIDLEYGSGLTRMNWSIERTLRDFYYLHLKYWKYRNPVKTRRYVQPEGDDARAKLPHFPRDVVPYLRGVRGFDASTLNVAELEAEETGGASTEENNTQRPKKRRQGSIGGLLRRQSSLTGDESQGEGLRGSGMRQKESWPERSRRKLDEYLQQLIRYLTFRPGTNRLCKFLELSALGVRLAAEGSYHGKEGRMAIISGKGIDFRRKLKPGLFKDRHSPKWFMVRHSYVVCTESPQDVDIYDVFLVDSDFKLQAKEKLRSTTEPEESIVGPDGRYKSSRRGTGSHHLTLYNSERKVKLAAKNARQLAQFVQSIRAMAHNTPWGKVNRFNSFAPVRRNVFAQWLVDGRDYMWNVSRAISMAKDVIYIHDWWLSPELYLRRPAAIAQKWRLDRLLQAKAREGVKVFVIMYRNVESAIPIDSAYSKLALLDLHPNIFVQRSPNQLRQNTFFWAHHEKICIVDHIIAFVGGIDLCFGRWDTPQHLLADDKPTGLEDLETPRNADNAQLWPGKDYSNPRVQDFYALDKPYEEMYDRSRVPRMPWHDIHMQVVGQPARDLTRHFVQRWNFILRSRVPSRPTPFLLPPPDFVPGELESLGLDGTCEVQILRSCTEWSIGTPGKTEHSIMDAYCTTISQSEHFIYIENQFYISRCEVNGVKIENSISDAIVERIIRAYTNDEKWRAVIVIPLMPGFQNTVDAQDGTSVRLIMQCQYRSICRGEESIFGRLRAAGIEPEDYIQFYSLRTWGKIGPSQALTTEQLYIHAKCMIVDDRVAIIASANINERSQRGDRDSECGAVVRDTDTLWSTMAGQPYRVGRFPHTLRMRLMREHLGIDVDALEEDDGRNASEEEVTPKRTTRKLRKKRAGQSEAHPPTASAPTARDGPARGVRVTGNTGLDLDLSTEEESRPDSKGKQRPRTADSRSRALTDHSRRASHGQEAARPAPVPLPRLPRMTTHELGLPQLSTLPALPVSDDTDIGGPGVHKLLSSQTAAQAFPLLSKMRRPEILTDCMKDPLNDDFYDLIWHAVAENNTALYRAVFRCQPDSEVVSWKDYHDYMNYSDRFSQSQGAGKSTDRQAQEAKGPTGPPGAESIKEKAYLDPLANRSVKEDEKAHGRHDGSMNEKAPSTRGSNGRFGEGLDSLGSAGGDGRLREKVSFEPGTNVDADGHFFDADNEKVSFPAFVDGSPASNRANMSDGHHGSSKESGEQHQQPNGQPGATKIHLQLPTESNVSTSGSKRSRRNTTRGRRRTLNNSTGEIMAKEDAEELLKMIQGHLVVWPYDWLVKEDEGGNWLYHIDQLAPLEI